MYDKHLFKIVLLLFFYSLEGTSQIVSPKVINSTGKSFQTSYAGMDINIGEPITGLIRDSHHQITQGLLQPNLNTLTLKVYLQGFYTGLGMMDNSAAGGCLFITGYSPNTTDADTLRLTLINPISHTEVETATAILQTDGSASFDFHNAIEGYYYLKVNHRNTLETWSANPVSLMTRNSYDFTTASSKAYGSNMIETFDNMGWAFYSGDISDASLGVGIQDDIIESQDYSDMENAVTVVLMGYVPADITGDGIVESSDYSMMENNVYAIFSTLHP